MIYAHHVERLLYCLTWGRETHDPLGMRGGTMLCREYSRPEQHKRRNCRDIQTVLRET